MQSHSCTQVPKRQFSIAFYSVRSMNDVINSLLAMCDEGLRRRR